MFLFLSAVPFAFAKVKKEQLKSMGAELKTNHSFSGLDVNGRLKSAHEGLSTVENEKPILDILDYPRNYNNRVDESQHWIR